MIVRSRKKGLLGGDTFKSLGSVALELHELVSPAADCQATTYCKPLKKTIAEGSAMNYVISAKFIGEVTLLLVSLVNVVFICIIMTTLQASLNDDCSSVASEVSSDRSASSSPGDARPQRSRSIWGISRSKDQEKSEVM